MKKTILVVEDDDTLREAYVDTLELNDYLVLQAGDGIEALDCLKRERVDMIVSDVNMPELDGLGLLKQVRQSYPYVPMLLVTAFGCISRSVDAMRAGAADYIVKPFEPGVLLKLVAQHCGEMADDHNDQPIAEDPSSQRTLNLGARVAVTDATVLITGESGTGKEVLARYIHQKSPRREKPFVAINCAAIPENMLEAILFGYEKGAFTGAHQSAAGKFEQANEGTLLLDEISEMDVSLQAKLLRVLQEQEVERLGGRKTIELNVRVLATSNRNLLQAVEAGKFREDLYYRLNVFPLHWQPLRERPLDIAPLAKYLMAQHVQKMSRLPVEISFDAEQVLLNHDWPGNIRELDNVIQRALILQSGPTIDVADVCINSESYGVRLPDFQAANEPQYTPPQSSAPDAMSTTDAEDLGSNLQDREFELIERCLQKNQFNRQLTAKELCVSDRTLRYKLAKMRDIGIRVDRKSTA
ncbi:MAG: sigma-54-dependent transcriptional regulator [Pseudomonadales bacterium]